MQATLDRFIQGTGLTSTGLSRHHCIVFYLIATFVSGLQLCWNGGHGFGGWGTRRCLHPGPCARNRATCVLEGNRWAVAGALLPYCVMFPGCKHDTQPSSCNRLQGTEDGGIRFVSAGSAGCCSAGQGSRTWLSSDLAGAKLLTSTTSGVNASFEIVSCPAKVTKDGHTARRVEVSGPFLCTEAAQAERAVEQVRAAVSRHGAGLPRSKTVLAVVNPKAGKGKCGPAPAAPLIILGTRACTMQGGRCARDWTAVTCRGARVWDEIASVLAAAPTTARVHMTEHAGHAIELAAAADLADVSCIAIVGGDGSFHEVVQVRSADTLMACAWE